MLIPNQLHTKKMPRTNLFEAFLYTTGTAKGSPFKTSDWIIRERSRKSKGDFSAAPLYS